MENKENSELANGALSHLSDELDDLRGKLKKAQETADAIGKQVKEKQLEIIKIKQLVYIGCTVKYRNTLFKVTAIEDWFGKAALHGSKQKKDGGFTEKSQFIGTTFEFVV